MPFLITVGLEQLLAQLTLVVAQVKWVISLSHNDLRGVAQLGSAPALGAGGPRFKSGRPD